jgi:D-glycero-D-manno-heptose 1,7-bisphosphate phosphatase
MKPAIFLDRDGVIVENRANYIRCIDDVSFIPGSLIAISSMRLWPVHVFIVSNQSNPERGYNTVEECEIIQKHIVDAITKAGGRITASTLCYHHPDSNCNCRKPKTGLIDKLKNEYQIKMESSVFIGDYYTDVELAVAIGAMPILVTTGRGEMSIERGGLPESCSVVKDLFEAVHLLRRMGYSCLTY